MSALFRTCVAERCQECRATIMREVQFKTGKASEIDRLPGDLIDVPYLGQEHVLPTERIFGSGLGDECPECGSLPAYEYRIEIVARRLVSVAPWFNYREYDLDFEEAIRLHKRPWVVPKNGE